MEIAELSHKQALTELANKLFMYTDARDWPLLQEEVFAEEVWFDMKSAGGAEPTQLAASAICDVWKLGFQGLDAVHHQAGHSLLPCGKQAQIYMHTRLLPIIKKQLQKGKRGL
jgi:hypothetical protein